MQWRSFLGNVLDEPMVLLDSKSVLIRIFYSILMRIFISLIVVSFFFDESFNIEHGSIMETGECYIDNSLPVPPCDPDVLFYIQRSLDANTLLYKLNKVKGAV